MSAVLSISTVLRRVGASPAVGVAVAALALALVATGCSAVPERGSSPSPSAVSGTPSPSGTSTPLPSTPLRTTTPPAVTSPPSPPSTPSSAFAFVIGGEATYSEAHHDYPATDVFADCGAEVRAPFAGTVTAVSTRDAWSGRTNRGQDRGGLSVALDAAGGGAAGSGAASGVRFYGSHLARLDVAVGDRVTAGQRLGLVGRTGSAAGTPCHLHVGLSPARCSPQDWWTRRGVVSPYPYLRSWEQGERLDPAAAVAAWWSGHGCPREP